MFTYFEKLKKYDDILVHAITNKPYDVKNNDNLKIIGEKLNINYRDFVSTKQIHEAYVRDIDIEDKGQAYNEDKIECDGIVTNKPNIPLLSYYADCVPLVFFDPMKKVIATVHSGWKGTVKKIGTEAILKMQRDYNCDVQDIIACIGPSIGACCFEVGLTVKEEFVKIFGDSVVEGNKVDLHKANLIQFRECGIREENIEDMAICTVCNNDKFYSYRSGDQNERFGVVMMLR